MNKLNNKWKKQQRWKDHWRRSHKKWRQLEKNEGQDNGWAYRSYKWSMKGSREGRCEKTDQYYGQKTKWRGGTRRLEDVVLLTYNLQGQNRYTIWNVKVQQSEAVKAWYESIQRCVGASQIAGWYRWLSLGFTQAGPLQGQYLVWGNCKKNMAKRKRNYFILVDLENIFDDYQEVYKRVNLRCMKHQ